MKKGWRPNPPFEYISPEFRQTVITTALNSKERSLKACLDELRIPCAKYVNGFRKFEAVPNASIDHVSNPLWKLWQAQNCCVLSWSAANEELKQHVRDYLLSLGYLLTGTVEYMTDWIPSAPEQAIITEDGLCQIVAKEYWKHGSADELTLMAFALGVAPCKELPESVPKSVRSELFYLEQFLAELCEQMSQLKQGLASETTELWPDGDVPSEALVSAFTLFRSVAESLRDILNALDESDEQSASLTDISRRFRVVQDNAIARLAGSAPRSSFGRVIDHIRAVSKGEDIDAILAALSDFHRSEQASDRFFSTLAGMVEGDVEINFEEFADKLEDQVADRLGLKGARALHRSLCKSSSESEVVDLGGATVIEKGGGPDTADPLADGPTIDGSEEQDSLQSPDQSISDEIVDRTDVSVVEDTPASGNVIEESGIKKQAAITRGDVGDAVERLLLLQEKAKRTDPELLTDAVWALIGRGELELAYHLSDLAKGAGSLVLPSPRILRIAILAPHLSIETVTDAFAESVQRDIVEWNKDGSESIEDRPYCSALALLASSALAVPALLRPDTGAPALLRELSRLVGADWWYEYANVILDADTTYSGIDVLQFRSQASWQATYDALHQDVQLWWKKAQNKHFKFHGANEVWNHLIKPKSDIHNIVTAIESDSLTEVEKVLALFESEKATRSRLENVDRQVRGGKRVHGSAFESLVNETKKAVELGRRYRRIKVASPVDLQPSEQRRANAISDRIKKSANSALIQLEECTCGKKDVLAVAAQYAARIVNGILAVFEPDMEQTTPGESPSVVIGVPLLRLRSVQLESDDHSEDFRVVPPSLEVFIDESLSVLQENAADHEVVEKLIEQGNFDSARSYWRHSSRGAEETQSKDQIERRISEKKPDFMRHLREKSERLRAELEKMVVVGTVEEEERQSVLHLIDHVDDLSKRIENYGALESMLERASGQLTGAIERAQAVLRQKLDDLERRGSIDAEQQRGVAMLLDAKDFLLASEQMALLEAGIELGRHKHSDPFDDFYRRHDGFLEQAEKKENWKGLTAVREAVRKGNTFAGLAYGQLAKPQRERAFDLIGSWISMAKRSEAASKEKLAGIETLLENIGFSNVKVSTEAVSPSRMGFACALKCDRIGGRQEVPVPSYGSQADGRYRILCLWGRPSEADIVNAVGDTTHQHPVLVLHFGTINHYRRASLAKAARERRRQFIVIDDFVIAFLAGQERSYLYTMFQATIPFGFIEPYTTAAGNVPPEVFFGRDEEISSIVSQTGSSFIYGGRQLGKTALLKEVRRRFHRPVQGKIAEYVDLLRDIVDLGNVYDEFWNTIRERLAQHGPMKGVSANARPETILERAVEWIEEEEGRRILLLMDEADRFLEVDGASGAAGETSDVKFPETRRIQGFVNRTNGRFKVVFAGLHQVQRVTRDVNQPFAHLGVPIQIGPLNTTQADLSEALELIRSPIESAGFSLSRDLALRILSETNYYPSLLQIYGKSLLEHLNRGSIWKNAQKMRPRYEVDRDTLDSVKADQNLVSQIRDRFAWTLQLDPRYELIANVIAFEIHADRDRLTRGFTVSEVRDLAQDWWSEGFHDVGYHEIAVLLEEMEGLGVLRRLRESGNYSLRNQSLLPLIGSIREIEGYLESEHDKPLPYQPHLYRKHVEEHNFLSPVSDGQISSLLRRVPTVSLVVGSPLGDINYLETYLRNISRTIDRFETPVVFESSMTADRFGRELAQAYKKSAGGEPLIILIQTTAIWSSEWIRQALTVAKRNKKSGRAIHSLFVADDHQLWSLMTENGGRILHDLEACGVGFWLQERWGGYELKQLKDIMMGGLTEQQLKSLQETTSGWPALLRALAHARRQDDASTWEQMLDALLGQYLQEPGRRASWSGALETIPEATVVFRAMAEYDESAEREEIVTLVEGTVSPSDTDRVLEWGLKLDYLSRLAGGRFQLDPFVRRLVALNSDREEYVSPAE